MSAEEINTSSTSKENHSLDGNEAVNTAAASSSVPITPEEVARQIEAADSLTRQMENLCDLMKEPHKDIARRNEGTSAQIQGPSGPIGERYDIGGEVFQSECVVLA